MHAVLSRHSTILLIALALPATARAQAQASRLEPLLPATSRELFAIPNSNLWRTFDSLNGKYFVVDGGPDGGWVRLVRADGSRIASIEHAAIAAVTRRVDRVAFLRTAESSRNVDNGKWPDQYVWTAAIDTASGRLVGEPRRVGIHPGDYPAFSADGRTLTYIRHDDEGWRIVAIPASGGDERVIVRRPGRIFSQGWSLDDRWIYYVHEKPDAVSRLERVPAAGGQPDSVTTGIGEFLGFSREGQYFAGMALRSQVIGLFRPDGERVGFVRVDAARPTWSAGSPNRLILSRADARHVLRSISLPDGTIRDLPVATGKDRAPRFTPDGKKLLFTGIVQERKQFFMSDADGRNRRSLPTKAEPMSGPAGLPVVSPDGRLALFGSLSPSALVVLDLVSGAERALPVSLFGRFAWRSDSKAVRYVVPTSGGRVIHEVTITGVDTILRDLGSFAGRDHLYFVTDTLVAALDSGGMRALSLRSGAMRTLFEGPLYDGYVWGDLAVSRDGRWLGLASYDSIAGAVQPFMMSLDGKQTRRVSQRFGLAAGIVDWLPNGRDVVLWGFLHKDGDGRIFLASLDGGPMRDLAPNEKPGVIEEQTAAVRPDGRQIVYGVDVSLTLRVIAMDLNTLPKR